MERSQEEDMAAFKRRYAEIRPPHQPRQVWIAL
jgi:hypothetical protein